MKGTKQGEYIVEIPVGETYLSAESRERFKNAKEYNHYGAFDGVPDGAEVEYCKYHCDFCDGAGEIERNIDGADLMLVCPQCNATGYIAVPAIPAKPQTMQVFGTNYRVIPRDKASEFTKDSMSPLALISWLDPIPNSIVITRDELEKMKREIAGNGLFEMLKTKGGKIISTANLSYEDVSFARSDHRIFIDEDSFGYVWMPQKKDRNEAIEFTKWMFANVEEQGEELVYKKRPYTYEQLHAIFSKEELLK